MRVHSNSGIWALAMAMLGTLTASASEPLNVSDSARGAFRPAPVRAQLALPKEQTWYLQPAQAADWLRAQALEYDIFWSKDAPADVQTLLFVIDRDGFWYQALQEEKLRPGVTNTFRVPLAPGAATWQPVGHAGAWHLRARLNPQAVGLRVFGRAAGTNTCVLLSARLVPDEHPLPPPVITRVRQPTAPVSCFSLFEAAFDLPDRYADPFDPAEVDVTATFMGPDGRSSSVPGFYYRDYYRLRDELQSAPQPQGRPDWRVRFCPRLPGEYRYSLHVRDRHGEALWREGRFRAEAADGPRFVRVSARDPRYLELDDGQPFVPIGHNIRSPDDSRMDDKFPWKLRHPEGTDVYARYFRQMAAAGENLVEVWSCAWSLGLEWSDAVPGYHGAGDYHLGNAWELDRVLELARRNGLRVNLVLNNHGRVCTWLDVEWNNHPYHQARGGWLDRPMAFFDDPRALDLQRRLCRYYIARWGWDPSLFAWELFSEVDLVGSEGSQRSSFDGRVVEWHRQIGGFFHTHDPNRHLVSTHVSADYSHQNPEMCRLPELDLCATDAYHYGPPVQIVEVLQNTARFNAAFGKPVLVTEFGGSPMAAGAEHLQRELHAALWTSAVTSLAGTPLFWWWQLVEERNLYPEYTSVARFLAGQDPRDPAVQPVRPELRLDSDGSVAAQLRAVAQGTVSNTVGWIYLPGAFGSVGGRDEGGNRKIRSGMRIQVILGNAIDGVYRAEFTDTSSGQVVQRADVRGMNGQLMLSAPPFTRDVAFRVRLLSQKGRTAPHSNAEPRAISK